jgi:hypothetical protein
MNLANAIIIFLAIAFIATVVWLYFKFRPSPNRIQLSVSDLVKLSFQSEDRASVIKDYFDIKKEAILNSKRGVSAVIVAIISSMLAKYFEERAQSLDIEDLLLIATSVILLSINIFLIYQVQIINRKYMRFVLFYIKLRP